jgi:hypothetical protein
MHSLWCHALRSSLVSRPRSAVQAVGASFTGRSTEPLLCSRNTSVSHPTQTQRLLCRSQHSSDGPSTACSRRLRQHCAVQKKQTANPLSVCTVNMPVTFCVVSSSRQLRSSGSGTIRSARTACNLELQPWAMHGCNPNTAQTPSSNLPHFASPTAAAPDAPLPFTPCGCDPHQQQQQQHPRQPALFS